MPLANRPNATYDVVLSTDSKLPKKEQPVFVFRYVNVAEWEEIDKLGEQFDSRGNTTEMINTAFTIIKKTLVNWRNMKTASGQKIAFNLKKLRSILAMAELFELMQAGASQRPSFEDKKKLDSPSGFSTAKPAKAAKD